MGFAAMAPITVAWGTVTRAAVTPIMVGPRQMVNVGRILLGTRPVRVHSLGRAAHCMASAEVRVTTVPETIAIVALVRDNSDKAQILPGQLKSRESHKMSSRVNACTLSIRIACKQFIKERLL